MSDLLTPTGRRRAVPVAVAAVRSHLPGAAPLPSASVFQGPYSHIHVVPRHPQGDEYAEDDGGDEGDGGPIFKSQSYQIHAATAAATSLSRLDLNDSALASQGTSFADRARAAELASQAERLGHYLKDGEEPPSSGPVSLGGYIKFKRTKAGKGSRHLDSSDAEGEGNSLIDGDRVTDIVLSLSASTTKSSIQTPRPSTGNAANNDGSASTYDSPNHGLHNTGVGPTATSFGHNQAERSNEMNTSMSSSGSQNRLQERAAAKFTGDELEIAEIFGSQLPSPNILRAMPGLSHGQVLFVREPNADVSAHRWSAFTHDWSNLGHYSNANKRIEGRLALHKLASPPGLSNAEKRTTLAYFAALARQVAADVAANYPQTSFPEPNELSLRGVEQCIDSRPGLEAAKARPSFNHSRSSSSFDGESTAGSQNRIPFGSCYHNVDRGTSSGGLNKAYAASPLRQVPSSVDDDPFVTTPSRHFASSIHSMTQARIHNSGLAAGAGPVNQGIHFAPPSHEGNQKDFQSRFHDIQAHNVHRNLISSVVKNNSKDILKPVISNNPEANSAYNTPLRRLPVDLPELRRTRLLESLKENCQQLEGLSADPRGVGHPTDSSATRGAAARTVLHDPLAAPKPVPANHSLLGKLLENSEMSYSVPAGASRIETPGRHRNPFDDGPTTSNEAYPKFTVPADVVRQPPMLEARGPGVSLTPGNPAAAQGPAEGSQYSTLQRAVGGRGAASTHDITNPDRTPAANLSYEANLEAWWRSGTQTDRQTEFLKSLQRPGTSNMPGREANPGANRLLVALYESLAGYVQGPAKSRYGHFAPHAQPPEWCIDRSPGGNNTFFGEDRGVLPPRLARDPRYQARSRESSYTQFEDFDRTPRPYKF